MSRARPQAIELAGSARGTPERAPEAGEIDPDAPLAVTLYFRRRTPAPPPGSAEDLERLMRPMTRHALDRQRARTHARAAARIAAFARAHGIAVRDIDLTGRRMVLEAPARLLMTMFGATVRLYHDGTLTFRARTGVLHIPREIAPWTRAVVGFDHGTSAATPLWAALIAMANAERGAPLGLVAPHLYGAPTLMRPIITGDNRQNGIGYAAGAGWNACTGLGVPGGAEIIAALAAIPMA